MMKHLLSTVSALVLFGSSAAYANTVLASDGEKLAIDISRSYPTRIMFEHDGGSKFIFNTVEGETPDLGVTLGESGDIFVSVITGKVGETVGGFLTTQGGHTYMVDFNIRDMRQDQVNIINEQARLAFEKAKERREGIKSETQASNLAQVKWVPGANHHQTLSYIIKALYNDARVEGFTFKKRSSAQMAIENLSISWVSGFHSANMSADKYRVTNYSDEIVLIEDKRDQFGDIVAFTSSKSTLSPQEEAIVLVVTQKEGS